MLSDWGKLDDLQGLDTFEAPHGVELQPDVVSAVLAKSEMVSRRR